MYIMISKLNNHNNYLEFKATKSFLDKEYLSYDWHCLELSMHRNIAKQAYFESVLLLFRNFLQTVHLCCCSQSLSATVPWFSIVVRTLA